MRTTSTFHKSFLVVGACLLLGTFYFYQSTSDFLNNTIMTNGTVVDIVSKKTRSGGRKNRHETTVYRPVIVFETKSGSSHKFTASVGTSTKHYAKGDGVEVLYPQDSPQEAKLNSFFSLWGIPVILGVLGAIFLMVGCSTMFSAGRKKKRV